MFFIVLFICLATTFYFYSIQNFNYWKKRGVKHDKPVPLFGTNANIFLMRKSWTQHLTDMYRRYPNEKVVGSFRASYPELMVRDPELVKRIIITDFGYFHLRSIVRVTDDSEPLLRHLFASDGDLWKLLRQQLSPTFTSGKLKAMFPLIVERAERLRTLIHDSADAPIDARELMARFTTDFISACVFGLDTDALSEEDSEFRKLGKLIINLGLVDSIKFVLKQIPLKMFNKISFTGRLQGKMMPLVKSILKERNYKPSGRNDFVDLLLECREKGAVVGESIEKFKPDGTPEKVSLEMTEELMAAQMLVFFTAGFETSSATTSYTLHLFAYNPDKQKKVQEEIDRVLTKYDNKLSYDAIKDMHYLEWCLKESMRIFPSLGGLIRECAHTYKVPGMDLTIEKGVRILIPVEALQHDPEYFENPEEFIPERFSPEQLNVERTKLVYMPFGDGPRSCIGERLGLMQSLAGLAAVLSHYSVEPAPTSVKRPQVDPKPLLGQFIGKGLPLTFKERKKLQ